MIHLFKLFLVGTLVFGPVFAAPFGTRQRDDMLIARGAGFSKQQMTETEPIPEPPRTNPQTPEGEPIPEPTKKKRCKWPRRRWRKKHNTERSARQREEKTAVETPPAAKRFDEQAYLANKPLPMIPVNYIAHKPDVPDDPVDETHEPVQRRPAIDHRSQLGPNTRNTFRGLNSYEFSVLNDEGRSPLREMGKPNQYSDTEENMQITSPRRRYTA